MNIAGYEVIRITRKSAQVGCAMVTREEVEALLYEMDKAPTQVLYRIECAFMGGEWKKCSSDELGGEYLLLEAAKRVDRQKFGDNWSFRVVPV